jgi:RHS repeat-associated protein
MALTDEAGDVDTAWDYDVFGAVRGLSGSQPNDFTFAGEQVDGSTGLQYLRARYYDPEVGKFISRDTFGGFPTVPLSQNLFTYAGNNPLIYTDPSGNCWFTVFTGPAVVVSATICIALVIALTGDAWYRTDPDSFEDAIETVLALFDELLSSDPEEKNSTYGDPGSDALADFPGSYEGGNWLPPGDEVARRLGVSRGDVREAVERVKEQYGISPRTDTVINDETGDIRIKDRPDEGIIGNVYNDRGKR